MRIIITADLHFDIARSVEPVLHVAEEISRLRADALLFLGDAGGRDVSIVGDCLKLFDRFNGLKLFVAGNHDIWVNPGEDSLNRLERELPEVCRDAGFHPLDIEPVVLGDVGIAGSIGWYDYSFRPKWLKMPTRFYEAKLGPAAAGRIPEYAHLVEDMSDLSGQAAEVGVRWMDGEYVRMKLSDNAFCDRVCDRLSDHVAMLSERCERIVVGLHHLPFSEIVPTSSEPGWAFAGAYMGSERLGRILLDEPKVSHVYCGHSHRGMCVRREHVACVNIGCTYTDKWYDVLEL